jgi:hypothetical protein
MVREKRGHFGFEVVVMRSGRGMRYRGVPSKDILFFSQNLGAELGLVSSPLYGQ